MEILLRDIRYALTMMRRNRSFTAAALLTLALGIGATTAVFSVVYGVLLKPLPYPEAERLVRISEEHPGAISPLREPLLSNLTYYAWIRTPRTVEQFAAYRTDQYTVGLTDGSARIEGASVTPALFALLGATPARGRFFEPSEARRGSNAVCILSDRGWRERFNADVDVIGRGVAIDGKPHTIVGVARPGFSFPSRDALLWTPLDVQEPSPDAVAGRRGRMTVMYALGRLRPGVTPAQAEAEGTAAARTTVRPMAANLLFGVGGPPVVHVRGLLQEMTSRIRPALLVLAAGVACVLLIACANVANLFLSRGIARQRELTVRAAIGASRARLTRQLLTESAIVSAFGGSLGLALAWALVRLAPAIAARDFPRLDDVAVDARAIGFTALASLLTTVLSGLAPALRGARFNLAESLHGGDGATAGGFRGVRARRLRDGLLMGEAAFAVLLLVGAILLARSFVRLVHVDSGYTAENVLLTEVYVPGGDAPARAAATTTLVSTILERARSLPDVMAAGAGNMTPLNNATMIAGFPAPWVRPGSEPTSARALAYIVTPGYAEALGLRLRAGRVFTEADVGSGTRPWIVNEEFARLYLPPQAAGYRFEQRADSGPVPIEIAGVVANVLKDGNDRKPQPEVYQLTRDTSRLGDRFAIAVRTTRDPGALGPVLRRIVRDVVPTAAVETVTLSQRVAASVEQPRFAMTVLAAFAVLAVGLASVGLYGVLSYGVSQRRRELGVRSALGAAQGDVIRLVVGEGLAVTMVGLVIGLVAAAALTRLMQGVLFGVGALDMVSFVAAPMVLLVVAMLASVLPARRAARTDPSEALRCE